MEFKMNEEFVSARILDAIMKYLNISANVIDVKQFIEIPKYIYNRNIDINSRPVFSFKTEEEPSHYYLVKMTIGDNNKIEIYLAIEAIFEYNEQNNFICKIIKLTNITH